MVAMPPSEEKDEIISSIFAAHHACCASNLEHEDIRKSHVEGYVVTEIGFFHLKFVHTVFVLC